MKFTNHVAVLVAVTLLFSSVFTLRRKKFRNRDLTNYCIISEGKSYQSFEKEIEESNCAGITFEMNFENYNDQNTKQIYECIEKIEHVLPLEEGKTSPLSLKDAVSKLTEGTKKNRFENIYSVDKGLLTKTHQTLYLNSATFIGKFKEVAKKHIEYENEFTGKETEGLIIATNAPLGDAEYFVKLQDKYATEYKDGCGTEFVKSKVGKGSDCYSRTPTIEKDNTILDFYNIVKEKNINYIVMLTDFVDTRKKALDLTKEDAASTNCKCVVKADKYFPFDETDEKGVFDLTTHDVKLENTNNDETKKAIFGGEDNFNKFSPESKKKIEVRELSFRKKGETEILHKVTHIHFRAWPDGGVPTGDDLKAFEELVRFIHTKIADKNNVIVHCTGGVGRTGTFISSVLAYGQGEVGKTFNLAKYILELRKLRPYFIESSEQLKIVKDSFFKFKQPGQQKRKRKIK